MRLNYRLLGNFLSILMLINGAFMLLCVPISLYFGEKEYLALLGSFGCSFGIGGILWFFTRNFSKDLKKKEGYLIVTFGWIIISLFGTLPYIFSGTIPEFSSAFFETISGYTTTGATVLTDIESVSKGILTWRSLTHWIGGMGIIVLAVAILPFLGIGGMQLFIAEAPGPSTDKLHPRIAETAKRLWGIYLSLTIIETILLKVGGMTWFDSINHALATMATGGFSTKNASIAFFTSPFIHYVITFFMFLAGTNFFLIYFIYKGEFSKLLKNDEFKWYTGAIAGITIFGTIVVFSVTQFGLEESFRSVLFSVVAVITTTGFVTEDYTVWAPVLTVIFLGLMFVGGSAGSTAGGVKIVRHVIIFKNSFAEFKRMIHPSGVFPAKYNGKSVRESIVQNILVFFMVFVIIFTFGSVALASTGLDFVTSIGAAASCLGNVGPGLGKVGPVENYSVISSSGKWILSFLMLVGRLELFTVLVILSPAFWKRV